MEVALLRNGRALKSPTKRRQGHRSKTPRNSHYDWTRKRGQVTRWRNEGDVVQKGEVLLEVETDQADAEVEASADGCLRKILVGGGETVPVLTLLRTSALLRMLCRWSPRSNR